MHAFDLPLYKNWLIHKNIAAQSHFISKLADLGDSALIVNCMLHLFQNAGWHRSMWANIFHRCLDMLALHSIFFSTSCTPLICIIKERLLYYHSLLKYNDLFYLSIIKTDRDIPRMIPGSCDTYIVFRNLGYATLRNILGY